LKVFPPSKISVTLPRLPPLLKDSELCSFELMWLPGEVVSFLHLLTTLLEVLITTKVLTTPTKLPRSLTSPLHLKFDSYEKNKHQEEGVYRIATTSSNNIEGIELKAQSYRASNMCGNTTRVKGQ
jgi:hypothetical protein